MTRRVIVAVTGASGSAYGLRLLEELAGHESIETHLVISRAGALNVAMELDRTPRDLEALADVVHSDRHVGASIASGSFKADAMVIAPCSMKTLAAVANGLANTLIARAADVSLKERRKTVLMVRESPLHLVHLRNMISVTEMGGIIFPPMPAFYARLTSLEEMVDQTVARVLDLIGVDSPLLRRWSGVETSNRPA